ncbi:12534_t:CDS:2 [Entrophospora sp. SA101]|nr:12534_t:CDS:2 [Entrophospora sp. SA101]
MTGVVVDRVVMVISGLFNNEYGEDYCPVIATKMLECNPSSQPIAAIH